jgi:hypothetical protein
LKIYQGPPAPTAGPLAVILYNRLNSFNSKKNENKIFRIEGFEDGKIKILHKPDKNNFYGVEKMYVEVDDFYNFLYHPELF